jgi:hypothetical protein
VQQLFFVILFFATLLCVSDPPQIHTVRIEYKRLQTSGNDSGKCPIRVFYDNVDPGALPTAEAICGPDPPPPAAKLFCKCLSTMLPSLNKRSRGMMKGYAWVGLTASTGSNVQTHQIANLAFTGSPKVKEIIPWAGPVEVCTPLKNAAAIISHFLKGGTVMIIRGDNFRRRAGARCSFGDVQTVLTLINSTTAFCTSPPSRLKQRHMVNLTIMFSDDDIANVDSSADCTGFSQPTPSDPCLPYQSRVGQFYYYINPVITKVTPHSGPVTGGTSITLEGSGFYPELLSISSCYHGLTTFQGAVQLGPLPLSTNVTDYSTTMTKVVCLVTKAAEIGLNTVFFSMNSQQPAINSPIPGYKDSKTQRFVSRCSASSFSFVLFSI